jgi:hypothetical protein
LAYITQIKTFKNQEFFMVTTFILALATAIVTAPNASCATANHLANVEFGASLEISLTNEIVATNASILLDCTTKNSSTNTVCYVQTDSRGMYEVVLIDDLGKISILNNPTNAPDSSSRMGGVQPGKTSEVDVPLQFDGKIAPGHYKLVAKQKIFLIKDYDRINMERGELISNSIDLRLN